jgi:hypothetical protein
MLHDSFSLLEEEIDPEKWILMGILRGRLAAMFAL